MTIKTEITDETEITDDIISESTADHLPTEADIALLGIKNSVINLLKKRKKIIKQVFLSEMSPTKLNYIIILNKDTPNSRNKVLDTLRIYDTVAWKNRCKITFEFVSDFYTGKLNYVEQIEL